MKLICRDIADTEDLAQVYNEQFAGVPHCYFVSPDEFNAGIRYRKNANRPHRGLHSGKIIMGEQNGKIVGFSDVVVAETGKDGQRERKGLIRMLTYQRGCRPVGQAILEESEKYLRELGMNDIRAFRISYAYDDYSYSFYHLRFGLVSDRTNHICALFRMNGYKVNEASQGEVFMNYPEYSVPEPVLPHKNVEIAVSQRPGRGVLPGLTVQAIRSGKEIGVCESVSMGGYCQASEAQDWVFIKWLGVEGEEQEKGWGRYLLQRNLWEMRKIGYKNTAISADITNHRAQLFYTNYGYRLADTCHGFMKEI